MEPSLLSTLPVALWAGVAAIAVGLFTLARAPRTANQLALALGLLGFGAESLASHMLLAHTDDPDGRVLWLRIVMTAGLSALIAWTVFVASLTGSSASSRTTRWRLLLGGAVALPVVAGAAVLLYPAFDISDIPGPFYAARLTPVGRVAVVAQVGVAVFILALLESCLRSSRGAVRWRTKYLLLGLGGILLARVFVLSQMLLFDVLLGVYVQTQAMTLLVGTGVAAISIARGSRPGRDLSVSRHLLYRSVVVTVLGVYFVAVGLLGWLLAWLNIRQDVFWSSFLIFASAVVLATFLLSEDLRWKLKRFISRNFYRTKYDYRAEWSAFTNRFASVLTERELGPQLVDAVVSTLGATIGVLYLADAQGPRYRLAGAVEVLAPQSLLDPESPMMAALRAQRGPQVIETGIGPRFEVISRAFGEGSVAVPLRFRDSLIGFMLVGPERTGAPYSSEDLDFLTTVSEQAAGAVATAQLSERLAQTREFEAFHRLTSFIVHDLKNCTSALSLLAQNALANFDDPDFQRDAIKTVSGTVSRMTALLAKLGSRSAAAVVAAAPVDLTPLLQEVLAPLQGGNSRVALDVDLAPVPAISGDADALRRVFQNLLTNAAEAIAGRGVITVRLYEDHGWAVVSVADTGCGMSDEFVQTMLFAPFRSTKAGGWGVGLYQARGLVEAHGGRIEAASKKGEGTAFRVRLPLAPPSRAIHP